MGGPGNGGPESHQHGPYKMYNGADVQYCTVRVRFMVMVRATVPL